MTVIQRRAACAFLITNLFVSVAAAADVQLEEVIVTAQKRSQNIRDVPVSLVAFDEGALARIGASGLEDLTARTPNVQFERYGDSKLSTPTIRGVFGGNTGGREMAVGTYVDEVYMGTSIASGTYQHLFDVRQVEILRGPQGTLFGRNTTGGAITLTTNRPSMNEMDGYVSARLGNYSSQRVEAAVSAPLVTDRLAVRLAGLINKRDGWTDNTFNGTDGNDEDYSAIRASVAFEPNDRSRWLLTTDYRDVNQHPGYYETQQPNPVLVLGIRFPPYPLNPTVPGPAPSFRYTPDGNPNNFSGSQDYRSWETLHGWGAMLRGDVGFSGFDFTTITAYRSHKYNNTSDTDRTPIRWVLDGDPESHHQFSQELRLTSTGAGSLSWIAGLYYYDQKTDTSSFTCIAEDNIAWLGLGRPGTLCAVANGVSQVKSLAAYGHADVGLGESWTLGLGLRATRDKKSIDYIQVDATGLLGSLPRFQDSHSWTAPTGDVALTYKFRPETSGYVKVARGYKAGGYNDALGSRFNQSFDPEYIWSYEGGIKSLFADKRIELSLIAFHQQWKDIQIRAIQATGTPGSGAPVFGTLLGNFGEAVTDGVEFEITARATEYLTLFGTLGYLDGEIREGDKPANGSRPQIGAGNALPGPKLTFTAGGDFSIPIGSGRLMTGANYSHAGQRELLITNAPGTSAGNDPRGSRGSYGIVNAYVRYTREDSGWTVGLWGKNVLDERYDTRVLPLDSAPLSSVFSVLGAPRTFGLELSWKF